MMPAAGYIYQYLSVTRSLLSRPHVFEGQREAKLSKRWEEAIVSMYPPGATSLRLLNTHGQRRVVGMHILLSLELYEKERD